MTTETTRTMHELHLADAVRLLDPDHPDHEARIRAVQDEYTISFWYAAGRVDEAHTPVPPGFERGFGVLRAIARAEYLTERRVSFGSLQGDWTEYLTIGRIA